MSATTLARWRADALANGSGGGSRRWTAAARLQAVIATAAMDEATCSAWCREQGIYPAELDGWKRDAIAGLGEPRAASVVEARQDRRRVKELERELHRKDKALAGKPTPSAAVKSDGDLREASPSCRSVFAIGEQFFEVFDALRCKGDGGYVTEAQDGEAAVFRLHVHGNVLE